MSCNKNRPIVTGPPTPDSTFTDTRDGQEYTFRHIGSQVWMTQNLNYAAAESWCYDNNIDYGNLYGRFYDWNTALNAAPPGWHLPTDAEWTTLTDFLGGESKAGGAMKATVSWESPNTGATNNSGFNGLAGGALTNAGSFYYMGKISVWWTSTENFLGPNIVFIRNLAWDKANVERSWHYKDNKYSIRCVRN